MLHFRKLCSVAKMRSPTSRRATGYMTNAYGRFTNLREWLIALSPQLQDIDSGRSRTFGSKIRSDLTGIQPFHPDFGAN